MAHRASAYKPMAILRHAVSLGNTYSGVVSGHPEFEDGTTIWTTIVLDERHVAGDRLVETAHTIYLLR